MLAKRDQNEKKNAWLSSFMDLILLVLCFFIMLFAASKEIKKDASRVFDSLKGKFDQQHPSASQTPTFVYDILERQIKNSKLDKLIKLELDSKKVSMLIYHRDLFHGAVFTAEADKIAAFISDSIFNITRNEIDIHNVLDLNDLWIEGGTEYIDDIDSKINVSLLRAVKLQNLLAEKGYSRKLAVKNMVKDDVRGKNFDSHIKINIYHHEIELLK